MSTLVRAWGDVLIDGVGNGCQSEKVAYPIESRRFGVNTLASATGLPLSLLVLATSNDQVRAPASTTFTADHI